jgi:hypothetical protein
VRTWQSRSCRQPNKDSGTCVQDAGTRIRCATHGGFKLSVVEPQNHPTAGFAEFGPQISIVSFQQESDVARDIIKKGASRQSNFVCSAWSSDQNPKSWFILPRLSG